MYSYRYRPGYGSKTLLIEFIRGPEKESFFPDLVEALSELEVKIEGTMDLWMNDEVMLMLSSKVGNFTLSKDIWDMAFIMAEDNQTGLREIDRLLSQSANFEREEVDFDDYK